MSIEKTSQIVDMLSLYGIRITQNDILALVSATFFWWVISRIVFMFITVPYKMQIKDEKEEAKCFDVKWNKFRLTWVSILHSIYALAAGGWYIYKFGISIDQPNTEIEDQILAGTCGYFIYDAFCEFWYQYEEIIFSWHHLFTILVFFIPICLKQSGSFAIAGMFIGEISGPNLGFREILKYTNQTKLEQINNIVFIISFLYARIFQFEWLFVRIHYSQSVFLFKFQSWALWFVSYLWIWQIANQMAKMLHMELFPNLKLFKVIYEIMKKLRKFVILYYVIILVFTSRYLLDYYNISSIPVQLFGRSFILDSLKQMNNLLQILAYNYVSIIFLFMLNTRIQIWKRFAMSCWCN